MLQLPIPQRRHRRVRPEAAAESPVPPASVTVERVELFDDGYDCHWRFSEPMRLTGTGSPTSFKVDGRSVAECAGGEDCDWYFILYDAAPPGSSWELTDLGGFLEPVSGHAVSLPQSGVTIG